MCVCVCVCVCVSVCVCVFFFWTHSLKNNLSNQFLFFIFHLTCFFKKTQVSGSIWSVCERRWKNGLAIVAQESRHLVYVCQWRVWINPALYLLLLVFFCFLNSWLNCFPCPLSFPLLPCFRFLPNPDTMRPLNSAIVVDRDRDAPGQTSGPPPSSSGPAWQLPLSHILILSCSLDPCRN